MNVRQGFAKVRGFAESSLMYHDYGDSGFFFIMSQEKGKSTEERKGVWRRSVANLIYSSNEQSFLCPSAKEKKIIIIILTKNDF